MNILLVKNEEIITSHHIEETEAGLKGLYILEISLKYNYITLRIATL